MSIWGASSIWGSQSNAWNPPVSHPLDYYRDGTYAQQAPILAKAISMHESGGVQRKGASGEFGAFQFMPSTWKIISKQVAGSVLPQTPENEQSIAQKKIAQLLQKFNGDVKKVALVWNTSLGGKEEPIITKGKNAKGVKYDSVAYAAAVEGLYKTFGGGFQQSEAAQTPQPPTATPPQPVQQGPTSSPQTIPQSPFSTRPQPVNTAQPFSQNKIADDPAQAAALISKVFPNAPLINQGLKTGDWGPLASALKQQSVDPYKLVHGTPEERRIEEQKLNGYVMGFVGAEFNAEPIRPNPSEVAPHELPHSTQTDIPTAKGGIEAPPQDSTSLHPSYVQKLKSALTDTIEYVQNDEERVRQLTVGKDLPDNANPYQRMALYHGRVGQKIEEGYNRAEDIADGLISYVGRNKTSIDQGRNELNQYLQALHAPERNAALGEGAAGITTEEAAKITEAATPEVKAVAQKALDLNKQTLNLLKDSGVISDDLFKNLTEKYKNHVPLQRIMDESGDVGSVLSGRGYDVKGTGIKKAVGSDRQVSDILTNIVSNYEQAVLRSEKNIVDSATLSFVRQNSEDLGHIFEIKKPRAIGISHEGTPLMEHTQDPSILQMYENGKPIWIKIKDDKLAIALRGVGREKLGGLMNAVATFTRFYAGLATRFNPEFAFPNKIRDLQETMTYLASQGDIGFKGAVGTALRDAKSTFHDVASSILGKGQSQGAKLYDEMKAMGGTTGGLGLSTRKQVQLNIDKIFETATSRPKQAASKLVEYVDNWNTIFEDSTRLSVYKQALSQGATKERAAFLAKEASINFNRMGKGGPVINALWMFSNASIQGTAKMLRAMKDPKVAASVSAAIGGSVAAVSEWNDSVDPDWRDKITAYDRNNSLAVMLPSKEGTRYVSIPVAWGLKPLLVMSNAAYDSMDGQHLDTKRVMNDLFSSVINGYNPIGGTDLVSAITPTVADVPTEIARNKSWSGAKIRPDFDPNAPKDIQYFQSLRDTEQGRLAIGATKEVKDTTGMLISPADLNYAIDQYVGGAGRSVEKTSNLIFGVASKEVPPADDWPFVSRFLRQRTEEETGQGTSGETDKIKEILQSQSRDRFELKQEAEDTYKELKGLPKQAAHDRFDALINTNPTLADKVRQIAQDEKLGLTYQERLIKDLGIDNGERARYLADKFNALKTPEEKKTLWEEYVTKKIITPDVAKKLKPLIKQ